MSFEQFLFNNFKMLFVKTKWNLKLSNSEIDQLFVAGQNYKVFNK